MTTTTAAEDDCTAASNHESWRDVEQMIATNGMVDVPTRIADDYRPELITDPAQIVEHLRLSLRGLLGESMSLVGHAFVFCTRDPITQADGRCIYRIRIKAGCASSDEDQPLIAQLFGMITRCIASYGGAQAVAYLSPGIMLHPAYNHTVNVGIITVVRKGRQMSSYLSEPIDRSRLQNQEWDPDFRPAPPSVRGVDMYSGEFVLDGLPPLPKMLMACHRTELAPWELLTAIDRRAQLRTCVLLETQSIVHMRELPPRHRVRTAVIDRKSRDVIIEQVRPWHTDHRHVAQEAGHAIDALHALGLIETTGLDQPPNG